MQIIPFKRTTKKNKLKHMYKVLASDRFLHFQATESYIGTGHIIMNMITVTVAGISIKFIDPNGLYFEKPAIYLKIDRRTTRTTKNKLN